MDVFEEFAHNMFVLKGADCFDEKQGIVDGEKKCNFACYCFFMEPLAALFCSNLVHKHG
jgi:hypothetical protein